MSGDAGDDRGSEADEIDDPDPSVTASGEGSDVDVGSSPLREFASSDGEPPRAAETLGDLGIYLGIAAVGLAVVGLAAATLAFLPLARVAIFFAIVLGSIAMGLGVVYQIFVLRA